eukprot:Phypoly_transcript_08751.p1 GENE.Phypoly_transcript_08751~~Phypoly_transcript_08751.p1  ORF type:complete len:448 (+),score=112.46 Phypoly_transcript_08751:42-1385(+)
MQIIKPETYNVPKPPPAISNNNNNNNNNNPAPAQNNNVPNHPFKATNMFVEGAGKMGSLVAAELAVNGYHVAVHDTVKYKIETLMGRIYDKLQHSLTQTKLLESAADIDAVLSRIRVAASMDEARDADFVFECAVDDLGAKKRIFARLDEICPKTTVLATNTMNIPLASIVPHCKRFPGRVIGTRFLYPVLFIPRIELSFHIDPFGFGIKKMTSFLKAIHKQPYFYSGSGPREVLAHDQVVAIYEQQANTYKKLGYPGKVTIPQVFNTPDPTSTSSASSSSSSSSASSASSSSSSSASSVPSAPSVHASVSSARSASSTSSASSAPSVTVSVSSAPSAPSAFSASPASSAFSASSTSSASSSSSSAASSASSSSSASPASSSTDPAAVLDDSKKCVICMEADRNSVLIPCGHICACFNCGDAVTKSASPICPICRVEIKSLVMTFVA